MKIGLIGTGMIGGTLAHLLAPLGHEVAVSNRRGPESLQPMLAELGPTAHAMTVEEAARWPMSSCSPCPGDRPRRCATGSRRGKSGRRRMNPYRAWGGTYDLGDSTSSEETHKRFRGAARQGVQHDLLPPPRHRRATRSAGRRSSRDLRRERRPGAKSTVSAISRQLGFAPSMPHAARRRSICTGFTGLQPAIERPRRPERLAALARGA
jgi:hypothetical protein